MLFPTKQNNSGFTLLLMVILVGVISVGAAVGVLLWSTSSTQNAITFTKMYSAKNIANACAEGALQRIHDNFYFSGSGNLILDEGNCNFTVSYLGSQGRQINVESVVGTAHSRVQVILDKLRPKLSVVSWQEVADF